MSLELEATKKALSKFGKDVVILAATYLQTRKRGYSTGKLMKSLDYDLGYSRVAVAPRAVLCTPYRRLSTVLTAVLVVKAILFTQFRF